MCEGGQWCVCEGGAMVFACVCEGGNDVCVRGEAMVCACVCEGGQWCGVCV